MGDYKRSVFPTTGGIAVAVSDELVTIEQEDVHGGMDVVVQIPRALFKLVLEEIFGELDPHELDEVAELARLVKVSVSI
jgi:hypothetical protein